MRRHRESRAVPSQASHLVSYVSNQPHHVEARYRVDKRIALDDVERFPPGRRLFRIDVRRQRPHSGITYGPRPGVLIEGEHSGSSSLVQGDIEVSKWPTRCGNHTTQVRRQVCLEQGKASFTTAVPRVGSRSGRWLCAVKQARLQTRMSGAGEASLVLERFVCVLCIKIPSQRGLTNLGTVKSQQKSKIFETEPIAQSCTIIDAAAPKCLGSRGKRYCRRQRSAWS